MTVLVIAGILLSVALPQLWGSSRAQRLEMQVRSLAASVRLARSEAIKRNGRVTLCASSSGTACTADGWETGWIILATLSDGSTRVISREVVSSSGVLLRESSGAVSFTLSGAGVLNSSGSFTACSSEVSGTAPAYKLDVGLTGRTTLTAISVTDCP